MKTPTALSSYRVRPSSLSLSNVDIKTSLDLEKSLSNLFLHESNLKNVIKKTKTLPLTNSSNKIWKSSKFSKSCKSVNDCCESDGGISGGGINTTINVKLRKKLSQSLKNININSNNTTKTNKDNNRLSLSLPKESQEILNPEQVNMNITENYSYAAQILSDPGAGNFNFRSMDELRNFQSSCYSDRLVNFSNIFVHNKMHTTLTEDGYPTTIYFHFIITTLQPTNY